MCAPSRPERLCADETELRRARQRSRPHERAELRVAGAEVRTETRRDVEREALRAQKPSERQTDDAGLLRSAQLGVHEDHGVAIDAAEAALSGEGVQKHVDADLDAGTCGKRRELDDGLSRTHELRIAGARELVAFRAAAPAGPRPWGGGSGKNVHEKRRFDALRLRRPEESTTLERGGAVLPQWHDRDAAQYVASDLSRIGHQ